MKRTPGGENPYYPWGTFRVAANFRLTDCSVVKRVLERGPWHLKR